MIMPVLSSIRTTISKHYYFLTGILMFFTFPSYDVWFLKLFPFFAWFSLVPLMVHVRDKKPAEVYRSSFFTGMVGVFLVYHWIGDFGFRVPGGEIIILVFVIPSLSVIFAGKIFLAEILSRKFEIFRILIYPAVWLIIDGIQSIGFLAFPWTYWAYSQYTFTPFIQVSAITGVFGVSFILIFANAVWADAYFKKRKLSQPHSFRLYAGVIAVIIVFIASFIYGIIRLNTVTHGVPRILKTATVQSCIDPWEDWGNNRFKYLEELKELSRKALTMGPDFIIWSESATLELISFDYSRNNLNGFEQEVLDFVKENSIPLLTGEVGVLFDIVHRRLHPQNNAVLIDENGHVKTTYPKINLVPFGEWFPYEKWFPWIKAITREFGGSSFVPGNEPIPFHIKGITFGALICYEGIFFRLCRGYRNLGAEFLVNITNLGWTKTYKGHMQGFANATFRAVENGIWFISAGNTGYSALVDPYGRITESIPILSPGYLNADMDLSLNNTTVYATTGDVILYLSLLFIATLGTIILSTFIRKRFIK